MIKGHFHRAQFKLHCYFVLDKQVVNVNGTHVLYFLYRLCMMSEMFTHFPLFICQVIITYTLSRCVHFLNQWDNVALFRL